MKALTERASKDESATSRLMGDSVSEGDSPALATNLRLLQQAVDLLDGLSQEIFAASFPPAQATIGAHLRHVIEFYQAFITQWPGGEIRYFTRSRDQLIETDKAAAAAALIEILRGLRDVPPRRPLTVAHFDGDRSQSDSTRELSYLADHAVHHFALIQLVARLGGLRLEESFGIASSTLASRT